MAGPTQKAPEALEWSRFLALAETHARTEPGKALLRALEDGARWAQDPASARLSQQETQETASLLDRDGLWGPLSELADPEASLDRLGRGAVLEVAELNLLRRWLYAADSWVQTPRDEIRGERIRRALNQLPDPLEPLKILDRILTPEGELSEKASPRLASLFQEIRSLKREISIVLDQLVKTFSQKGVLQENFSDVRDGRYVIPVKISHQNDVEGIIYEASASRQTVFVEPKEVAPLNNRLRQRQNELLQEIFVVLESTSKKLQPFTQELLLSVSLLSHWDAVQAKARLGTHYGGRPIQVTEERSFRLQNTAHPLLWWSLPSNQIIRNELDLEDPTRTLLITGPNTGGKTVLLKTLGLAGICARTGFPFPGTGQPIVPFFDSIFCDLGDPQSIEEHLSSFSGHILRFREILEKITDQSLVLLDELNTATDPEEGAALGRAFLETVMSRGSMIVATTHDPHLKALAISDERILNASMAFDESARTPTYHLVLGVPGRSRALETARRLGLPSEVLELATSYLSREHLQFENLLSRLQKDTDEAASARKQAIALREEAESLRKEWMERTQSQVADMMDRTRTKLRRIVEQAQDEVRAAVRKLDELRSRKDLDATRAELNQSLGEATRRMESALSEEAPEIAAQIQAQSPGATEAPAFELKPGMQVRVPKWKNTGILQEIQGNKVKVLLGKIQMTLTPSDVEVIGTAPPRAGGGSGGSGGKGWLTDLNRPSAPPAQLDLRGERFDQAMSRLEQYLDQAYRSGAYAEVTIIHGLGTGALREGARKLLAELPYIKEFRDGGPGKGGTGSTLVSFDRS